MLGLLGYVAAARRASGAALAGVAELDDRLGERSSWYPGGLFELLLPLWLFARGFSEAPEMLEHPTPTSTAAIDVSRRRAAIVAGLGLLVMLLVAFSSFSAFQRLIVEGDATATAHNIAAHEPLVRRITGGFLIVAALDVLVAWALYVLLRPVSPSLAVARGLAPGWCMQLPCLRLP